MLATACEKGPDVARPAPFFRALPLRIRSAAGARLPQGHHLSRAMRMTSTASATIMNTQVMENPPSGSLTAYLYRTTPPVTAGKPYLWQHHARYAGQTVLHALQHMFISEHCVTPIAPRDADAPHAALMHAVHFRTRIIHGCAPYQFRQYSLACPPHRAMPWRGTRMAQAPWCLARSQEADRMPPEGHQKAGSKTDTGNAAHPETRGAMGDTCAPGEQVLQEDEGDGWRNEKKCRRPRGWVKRPSAGGDTGPCRLRPCARRCSGRRWPCRPPQGGHAGRRRWRCGAWH